MLGSVELLQLGLEQGSVDLAGVDVWMGSGSRVTDGCWDTSLEMV